MLKTYNLYLIVLNSDRRFLILFILCEFYEYTTFMFSLTSTSTIFNFTIIAAQTLQPLRKLYNIIIQQPHVQHKKAVSPLPHSHIRQVLKLTNIEILNKDDVI